jgi:hypothetical protein
MQPSGGALKAGEGRHRPENEAGFGAGRSAATTRPAVFRPKGCLDGLGAAGPNPTKSYKSQPQAGHFLRATDRHRMVETRFPLAGSQGARGAPRLPPRVEPAPAQPDAPT